MKFESKVLFFLEGDDECLKSVLELEIVVLEIRVGFNKEIEAVVG